MKEQGLNTELMALEDADLESVAGGCFFHRWRHRSHKDHCRFDFGHDSKRKSHKAEPCEEPPKVCHPSPC